MAPVRTRALRWAIPFALVLILVLTHSLWLRALGAFLVDAQPPEKADIIVVLAGDDKGNRVLKAAELVKEGYAPRVLVSGPKCCYGQEESELAVAFAVRHGYPAAWFRAFPIQGSSTAEEAREIVRELDRERVGRFLVVTSNYHTRRASRIFARLVPPERLRIVAARDWIFTPDGWWHTREGQKQWFFEWAKTVANWAGL